MKVIISMAVALFILIVAALMIRSSLKSGAVAPLGGASEGVATKGGTPNTVGSKSHPDGASSQPVTIRDSIPAEERSKRAYQRLRQAKAKAENLSTVDYVQLMSTLDESCAKWFADQYRQGLSKSEHDSVALNLAVASGGHDASELLLERLKAAGRGDMESMNLMLLLGGVSGWSSLERVPLSNEFRDLANEYSNSQDEMIRRAGVGILGWFPTVEARTNLMKFLMNDTSDSVRLSAMKGLGQIGDASTLLTLRALSNPLSPTSRSYDYMTRLMKEAIESLEARFPK